MGQDEERERVEMQTEKGDDDYAYDEELQQQQLP